MRAQVAAAVRSLSVSGIALMGSAGPADSALEGPVRSSRAGTVGSRTARRRAATGLALVLAVVGAGLAGCQPGRAEDARLSLPPSPAEPVKKPYVARTAPAPAAGSGAQRTEAQAGAGSGPEAVRLTGSTGARRRSHLAAAATGMLETLAVREGDMVAEGAVLARLDATVARLQVEQAAAGLKGMQAQLAGAEREAKRLKGLAARDAVPRAELERAETSVEAARAQVAASRAALALARHNVEETIIRAPFAGLVTRRLMSEGEWVSTMPPAPLVELAEVDPLELRVEAPERLLNQLKVGDRLTGYAAALDRTFEARITRVVRDVNPANRSFLVVAEVPNADASVPPGVFVEITLGAAPGDGQEAAK